MSRRQGLSLAAVVEDGIVAKGNQPKNHEEIHLDLFEADLKVLKSKALESFDKASSDADIQAVFDKVKSVIALTYNTDVYDEIYKSVKNVFGNSSYSYGTIGAYFTNCEREKVATSGMQNYKYQCSPVCLSGVKPPGTQDCDLKIYSMRGMDLVLVNTGNNDKTLYIYTLDKEISFDDVDISNIKNLGSEEVEIYHITNAGTSVRVWKGVTRELTITEKISTESNKKAIPLWIIISLFLVFLFFALLYFTH
jgi:hypothetical protein